MKVIGSRDLEGADPEARLQNMLDSSVREAENLKKEIQGLKKDIQKASGKEQRILKQTLEKHEKHIRQMANQLLFEFTKLAQDSGAKLQSVQEITEQISNDSKSTASMVNGLREFSARQRTETLRWQEGYDYKLLSCYLKRLIASLDEVEDKIQILEKEGASEERISDVKFLSKSFVYNLDGEGLVQFVPELSEKMDDTRHEAVSTIETDDQGKDRTISQVIRPGYELISGEDDVRLIRTAQVQIYVTKKQVESDVREEKIVDENTGGN
jgi:molecular chaperone GrpE (heat shock protein)